MWLVAVNLMAFFSVYLNPGSLRSIKNISVKHHRASRGHKCFEWKYRGPHCYSQNSECSNFQWANLSKPGRNVSAKWLNIESVLIMNSPLPLIAPVTWLRYWWGEIPFIHILLVCRISGFQQRKCRLFEKRLSSLLLAGLSSPPSQLVCGGKTGIVTAPFLHVSLV